MVGLGPQGVREQQYLVGPYSGRVERITDRMIGRHTTSNGGDLRVSVPKLDQTRDLPWLDPGSQQARDVARFHRASDGFVALDPERANRIIDIRYSFLPNAVSALWSIELAPEAPPEAHVPYWTHREQARDSLSALWRMISGG